MKKYFSIPYKWELVIWLFLAFFLNQADKQIFNVLLSDIRDGLGLNNDDMGTIVMVMTIVYGVLVPVGGMLALRVRKKSILFTALLVWSAATLFTGYANSFVAMILLRSIATGGGEAFYSPPAVALIADSHADNTRSTALSLHQSALYVGFILSSILAPMVANAWGWQYAFYLFGGFGILLAFVILFRVKESVPEQKQKQSQASMREALKAYFACPTAILLTLGCAGLQFVGMAFYTWMPTYLIEELGVSKETAGFHAAFYFQLASIFGVLIGARISDKHVGRHSTIRAWVQAAALMLGAPFVFLMADSSVLWIVNAAMFGFGLFKGAFDSNYYTALYDVTAPQFRSSAASFILMISFLVSAFAPKLLGALSTAGYTLSFGLQCMSYVLFFSAVPIMLAIFFTFRKDRLKIQ